MVHAHTMDEIESVAADTTFEADHRYSNLDDSESEAESLEPPPKSLRLDPPYPTYLNDEPLYHHRSISDQFDRERPHHRPVGIAQPIRIEDTQCSHTSTHTSSDIHVPVLTSTHMQALAPLDQGSDSDHSQKQKPRYNKFSSEKAPSNVEPQSSLSLTAIEDSESSVEYASFTAEGRECVAEKEEEEEEGWSSPNVQSRILYSPHGSFRLPLGKKVHVFISHGTLDQKWVREYLISGLRSHRSNIKVQASYHCMPDHSCYDDHAIRSLMRGCCVIVICISAIYLRSDRCVSEWTDAVALFHEEQGHRIIVIALGVRSLPKPLEHFLLLDFIEPSKRKTGWHKLLKEIDYATSQALPPEDYAHPSSHADRMQEEFEAEFGGVVFPGDDLQGPTSHQALQETHLKLVDQGSHDPFSDHVIPDIPREAGQWEGAAVSEEVPHPPLSKDVEEGEVSDSSGETEESQAQSKLVANFYDKLAQPDADKRNESPILHMRNFNNWVKTVLIRNYLPYKHSATVLDLCCGKGGDMPKWKRGGVEYLVCADISESSVDQCQERYYPRKPSDRNPHCNAEFHVADCCEVRLRERYHNPARRFHLTSCQFSVHYSFESYERAHMMLRNACENLVPGGCFIGTTIDASELIHRLRCSSGPDKDGLWSIGNKVFSVTLSEGLDPRDRLPLFGTIYNFKLHGVVDLPEFLVHFPLLTRLLQDFGMELKLRQNFYDFFTEHRNDPEDSQLLYRMSAFDKQNGRISADEWEVIGLYLVYVFQKKIHDS